MRTDGEKIVALLTEIRDRMPERVQMNVTDVVPDSIGLVTGDFASLDWPNEPVDITEEPPVGSQVTDRDGDVWERRTGRRLSWHVWLKETRTWDTEPEPWELADYRCVTDYAPLRPTTDEDRKRVGLPTENTPEGTAPADLARVGIEAEPTPTDDLPGEPDEALARVIFGDAFSSHEGLRLAQLDVARAAREHIEAEMGKCYAKEDATAHDRAEKAEAALADMTRQREAVHEEAEQMGRAALARAKERDEWQARHAALREDVERVRRNRTTLTDVLMCIADALDLDDERGEQA